MYRREAIHRSRYRERSPSPAYSPRRRSRIRSRSPILVEFSREHRKERHCWSRENGRHRRSISPQIIRRSRSSEILSRGRRRRSRSRSQEARHHRSLEISETDTFEHEARPPSPSPRGHHHGSRNGKLKNDKYHWVKPTYSEENSRSRKEESTDLREIIKRSREETRSPHNTEFDGVPCEADEYFREFVPKIEEDHNHATHWSQSEERRHDILTFKKSIHNDIALEAASDGNFVSLNDSHPDIPFFDGTDQEITPRQFVKKIEDLGYANGWSSNELKCQMAAKLQGAAREWFLKDELMNEPWDKVKMQFIKMHPTDMDYFHQLKKMMDRGKFHNESYSNYFTFKTMLMSAVGITGRQAVSCLIGGLGNPELESKCYQKNFAIPEMLFEYLNMRNEPPEERKSNYSGSKKDAHKKPLLKTPEDAERIPMNNSGHHQTHQSESHNIFNTTMQGNKSDYDPRFLMTVKIKNHLLDAYNDLSAQSVTIMEESAKHIHLDYSRRRTTIIGSRGVPVMAIGDCEARIGIDQATVNIRAYIVPNSCQEKPVVIGKSMREHAQVTYHESSVSVSFKQNSSFHNEKRKDH